jgi:CheY-like chemotaxis protein
MRERAELASVAKDHFLATVSHELRTPLNVILGWTVVLRERERELAPEVQRALSVIERNARAQARLIEDVLDLSRISTGKLSLNLGPVHIGEAVRVAALNLRPAAEAKGVTLSVDGAVNLPQLMINADGDRVQQVLWNLLTNALKFTPKGGSIVILAERVDTEVRVQVKDTGEGMSGALLPHVFEPFRQADASTTRRHGGLGLGLSLVNQIVAAHGGTVEASSPGVGRGATFLVRLPARAATEAVKSLSARKAAALRLGGAGPLSGIAIVVVDDEQDARELVGEAFSSAGATVHLAASAEEALSLIARVRPAALVSDIGMPHEDGYALMRRLRELSADQGGQIPALALTAYARTEDAERAFEAGYQRHVAKPVDPLTLVDLVAGLVGRSTPVPKS